MASRISTGVPLKTNVMESRPYAGNTFANYTLRWLDNYTLPCAAVLDDYPALSVSLS